MKITRQTRKKRAHEAAFDLPHDLVPHPRARQMAQATHRSVPAMSVDEIRSKAWQMRRSTIVPGTAILPTEANQQYIDAVYGYNVSKALLARSLGTAEDAVEKYLGGVK